ncbi:uncharacterized protein [Ciconia boyciana]|uniref:uncharacterized protein n=1 Tax=Ciconia boyciana TaxID=52775 RepID=UPI003BA07667
MRDFRAAVPTFGRPAAEASAAKGTTAHERLPSRSTDFGHRAAGGAVAVGLAARPWGSSSPGPQREASRNRGPSPEPRSASPPPLGSLTAPRPAQRECKRSQEGNKSRERVCSRAGGLPHNTSAVVPGAALIGPAGNGWSVGAWSNGLQAPLLEKGKAKEGSWGKQKGKQLIVKNTKKYAENYGRGEESKWRTLWPTAGQTQGTEAHKKMRSGCWEEKKKPEKVLGITRRDMDYNRTRSFCFTSPENLGESTSSVLYAVTFSASYEGQSFELERYKATISCKNGLLIVCKCVRNSAPKKLAGNTRKIFSTDITTGHTSLFSRVITVKHKTV